MSFVLDKLPFDPAAHGYCSTNARLCVAASRVAYDECDIENVGTSTQVVFREMEDYILIAFRGSKDLKDWITDARVLRSIYIDFRLKENLDANIFNARIHTGFLSAINSVMGAILGDLLDIRQGVGVDKPIVITGHSLGGALAVLCAYQLAIEGIPVQAVYTFGQPRVGNRGFTRHYDHLGLGERTFRIVHEEDIVPRIPGLLCGFRHTPVLMFFSSFSAAWGMGKVMARPAIWFMALSDVLGICQDWAQQRRIALTVDHPIDFYTDLYPV